MATKPKPTGRPPLPKGTAKERFLQVRLQEAEHSDFSTAAQIAGVPLSSWVRERLRLAVIQELERHGKPVRFLQGK